MTKTCLALRCRIKLCGVNDNMESDSAMSMTPRSRTQNLPR